MEYPETIKSLKQVNIFVAMQFNILIKFLYKKFINTWNIKTYLCLLVYEFLLFFPYINLDYLYIDNNFNNISKYK